ncbi:MAG: hypothetical protein DMD38_11635 [Gemmatimonadetes bacterium]|nr:MAG: hypothetical protein DMD38_11635 [Gemmatimonadota bacterium]
MVLRANPGTLRVVQVAESLARTCATLAKGFFGPGSRAQADQLVRASSSIASNIVEGCGRGQRCGLPAFSASGSGLSSGNAVAASQGQCDDERRTCESEHSAEPDRARTQDAESPLRSPPTRQMITPFTCL